MSDQTSDSTPIRKPYRTPVIEDLGSLREVTAGNGGSTFNPSDSPTYDSS